MGRTFILYKYIKKDQTPDLKRNVWLFVGGVSVSDSAEMITVNMGT